jgi:hemoglobin-like flavoprotein
MLTANDIALVRASFALVVPIQDTAADLFYDRLFAIAPRLRELFPAGLREQKRKLMQMIATAVGGLSAESARRAPFRLWCDGGALRGRRRGAAVDARAWPR